MTRGAGRLVAVLALASIGGCHSSESHTGTTQGVTVAQGSITVPAHRFVQVPMTTGTAGTLTLQINYAVAGDIVVAGIGTSSCTGAVSQSTCSFLSYSETPSSSAPSKTLTAAAAPAGNYVVILGNVGSADESLSYQATLATS